jgi:hypothetical protein
MNTFFRGLLLLGCLSFGLISCGQTTEQPSQQISSRDIRCGYQFFGIEFRLGPISADWVCISASKSNRAFNDVIYIGRGLSFGGLPESYFDVLGNLYIDTGTPNYELVPDDYGIGNNTARIQLPPFAITEKYPLWLELTGRPGNVYKLHRVQEVTTFGLEQRIGVHYQDLINGIRSPNTNPVFKQIEYQGLNTFDSRYKQTTYWMFQNNANASLTIDVEAPAQWLSIAVFDTNGNQVMELGGTGHTGIANQISVPLEQLEDGTYYFLREMHVAPSSARDIFSYKILFN